MRILIAVVIGAAILWGGYWFVGANRIEARIRAEIAGPETGPLSIEAAEVDVRGFPNRFDARIDAPVVTAEGLTWRAPFVEVMALSYLPNRVIVALPNEQTVDGDFGAATILSDRARASLRIAPGTVPPVSRSNLVVDAPRVVTGALEVAASRLLFATEARGDGTHRVGLTVDDIDLGDGAPGRVTLDAMVSFDGGDPAPEAIEVTRLTVTLGGASLKASGRVSAGPGGFAQGTLDVEADGLGEALDMATRLGLLPPGAEAGLAQMARGDGIQVVLRFEDGLTYLGPVAIGPAFKLR